MLHHAPSVTNNFSERGVVCVCEERCVTGQKKYLTACGIKSNVGNKQRSAEIPNPLRHNRKCLPLHLHDSLGFRIRPQTYCILQLHRCPHKIRRTYCFFRLNPIMLHSGFPLGLPLFFLQLCVCIFVFYGIWQFDT